MPHRGWQMRIEDILEAIERIQNWTEDSTRESFCVDARTVQAVAYNLLIVGEAVNAIPEVVQCQHPQVPWSKMRAMRNVVVHQYFDMDPDILWQTIQSDLPPLVPTLREML